ncbi:MAG TPA: endolytic transglycosylase MltG [Candidatus Paceibacterota bacterium]|nr:endolytic transglycosylase MltG [Candidatus Paceibacterota bacterium]HPT18174.1 endolytic transglycosylase MltG [Candidatus Paceibacterota bacterium]
MENFSLLNNNKIPEENIKKQYSFKKKVSLFVLGLFSFLFIGYFLFLSTPCSFPKGIVISIEKGESLRDVSLLLKEKKIIRSRVSFETFVILFGGEKHISQGDYLFENKLPVFEVAKRIVEKDRHLASVKITIPEGYNLLQIADAVSTKLKNFNREKFFTEAKEGYLFPDTYFFFSTDSEEQVVKYMTENFEKKIKTVKSEINDSGKTENEIIIMASLIEKEAKGDADRGYISGILWNRLKKGMPLQVDSAEETYKTKGLPENPICNPGLKAIKASISPINSPYLYYLHDKNGIIHYAKTFDEHKKNKLKYLN